MRWRAFVWPVAILLFAAAFYLVVRHKRDLVDFQVYRTAATRALAQGVREACFPKQQPDITGQSACAEIGDAPGSRVCVDETATRALDREIECGAADDSAEAIELSGSAW